MKIAQVVSTFWPKIGGMGEVCRQEARYLAQAGIETAVFTLRYPNISATSTESYQIKRLWPLFRLGDGGVVPQLSRAIKNYDLVHLHYPFYGGAEWVWFNKMVFKRRYIVTYHMDASPYRLAAKAFQSVYDRLLAKKILGGADKVIALDREHFGQANFSGAISADKVVEINNGIDANVFHPTGADWSDLGFGQLSGKPVILFVGNFLPFKRFDLILSALRLLPPAVSLLAVGDGYKLADYKHLAEKWNLAERVLFAGKITDQNKLADFYSAASCLVVAADRAESFSLAALEALSCGTPAIVSNIPGVRGRVDDGRDGLIFSAGEASDLADKLKLLLAFSPDRRREMGRNGRDKVLKNYTWESHGDKLLSTYHQVLGTQFI